METRHSSARRRVIAAAAGEQSHIDVNDYTVLKIQSATNQTLKFINSFARRQHLFNIAA